MQSIRKFELDVKEFIKDNDINEWKKELSKLRNHFSEDVQERIDIFLKCEIPNNEELNGFLKKWINSFKRTNELIDELPEEIEQYIS